MTSRRMIVALVVAALLAPVRSGFVPPARARGEAGFILGGIAAGLLISDAEKRERRERRREREAAAAAAAAAAAYAPPAYYVPVARPRYRYEPGGYYEEPVYSRRVVYRRYRPVRYVEPSYYYSESY